VGTLKQEIDVPDEARPSIFDDDGQKPESMRESSIESAASGMELLTHAARAHSQAKDNRAISTSSARMLGLSTVSLEAAIPAEGLFSQSLTKELVFPPAVAEHRATTVDFLKKMGLLQSTSISTDALVQERLGLGDSLKSSTPPKKRLSPKKGAKQSNNETETVEDKHIREWDVLSGRGGKSNHHPGNKRFRQVVDEMKAKYRITNAKTDKTALSKAIVDYVHGYGGRFLKQDESGGKYRVMTTMEARKKTSQALRETKELKWKL
jgi:hypothetical protein